MAEATRAAFGRALARLGQGDPRIVVLDADLATSLMSSLDAEGQPVDDPDGADVLDSRSARPLGDEPALNDLADAPTLDPALPIEVVFVDAGVEDADTLLDGLRQKVPGVHASVLP